jgi:protein gp37
MSDNSKITWTDSTWNPIVGCSKCSPGCDNCYAERMAKRLKAMDKSKYCNVIGANGKWNGKTTFVLDAISKPLSWKKPRKIFVCSMSDLFHESVNVCWIIAVFVMIKRCPQHTFQILTKRPDRALKFFQEHPFNDGLPNVWFGVTVCNQDEANKKIPVLLEIDAVVRFLSIEPMLGLIDLYRGGFSFLEKSKSPSGKSYQKIDWVICGGETGPEARPVHPDWILKIKNQCITTDVPFFFKQWGEYSPTVEWAKPNSITPEKIRWVKPSGKVVKTGIGQMYDGDALMHRGGSKNTGNRLNGKVFEQFPEVPK